MAKKKPKQQDPLARFGEFLMHNCRDQAIDYYDRLVKGRWKSERLRQLQADLKELDESQRDTVRRCVVSSIDNAIHHFLFALHELADFDNDIQVIVQGQNIAEISDGLQGELFGDEGWMARYSDYGEPPDDDE